MVALLLAGLHHPVIFLRADHSPFQPPPTPPAPAPALEEEDLTDPDGLTTSSWLVCLSLSASLSPLCGISTVLGSVHTGGGSTPVLTAMSLAASGLGPPTLGLVSELCDASLTLAASCFLVLSSNLVKDQGRASLTEAGGGLGPPRPPAPPPAVTVVPTVEAAMAAACCVCELGLAWREE